MPGHETFFWPRVLVVQRQQPVPVPSYQKVRLARVVQERQLRHEQSDGAAVLPCRVSRANARAAATDTRTMDAHFADLFTLYEGTRRRFPIAA